MGNVIVCVISTVYEHIFVSVTGKAFNGKTVNIFMISSFTFTFEA